MSGYARAHRGRWDHPLFKNKQEAAVWAWMCDTARWRQHSFQTKCGLVTLERGQLLISERGIGEDFGMHKNTVRRLLSTMLDAGMISLNRDHAASRAGTIATVINYDRYQTDSDQHAEHQDQGGTKARTMTGPRRDQDRTTREEREEREEGEEEGYSPSDSSIGEPISPSSQLPAVDEIVPAFAAYEALRREFVPGSRPITLSPDRRKKLTLRLRDTGGPEGWAAVLARIRGSPFLRGETDRFAFATIDWLLKPENLRKVQEGNYDERRPAAAAAAHARASAPIDAIRAARAAVGLG